MTSTSAFHTASKDPEPVSEMNMTPLIDVMLVLIIMLIITIPRQQHAVDLNLPGGKSTDLPKLVIEIAVAADGSIAWNGETVPNRASLETRLREAAASTSAQVHVRADRAAPYKVVAGILSTARNKGVVRIGVVGTEQLM